MGQDEDERQPLDVLLTERPRTRRTRAATWEAVEEHAAIIGRGMTAREAERLLESGELDA